MVAASGFASRAMAEALDFCSVLRRNGMTPDPWEEKVLRVMPAFALVCWSRQTGKTTTLAALAGHIARYCPGWETRIASVNEEKAAEMLARTARLMEAYEAEFPFVTRSAQKLEWANGARILAVPAKPTTARGPTTNLVILDEAAWTTRELFDTIFPTLRRTNGSLIAISTPPEKPAGWWWEQWTQNGKYDGEEAARLIKDDWLRSYLPPEEAGFDEEHMEKARRLMSEEAFDREYMLKFPKPTMSTRGLMLPDLSSFLVDDAGDVYPGAA